MKNSNWKLGMLAAAVVAATFVGQAQAAPTISLNISGATVDIVANGLPSAAGSFSLSLAYAPLVFSSYVLGGPAAAGPLTGTFGNSPVDFGSGDLGGTFFLSALADIFALEPDVLAAQNSGGPFVLGSVMFTGAIGATTLGLRDVAISDFGGTSLLACTGAACVAQVPEPTTTALLIAAALGGFALRRRKLQAD